MKSTDFEGIAFITFDNNYKVTALTIQYVPTWVVKARKAMASMPATKNLPATGDAADTLTLALPFGLAGAALLCRSRPSLTTSPLVPQ